MQSQKLTYPPRILATLFLFQGCNHQNSSKHQNIYAGGTPHHFIPSGGSVMDWKGIGHPNLVCRFLDRVFVLRNEGELCNDDLGDTRRMFYSDKIVSEQGDILTVSTVEKAVVESYQAWVGVHEHNCYKTFQWHRGEVSSRETSNISGHEQSAQNNCTCFNNCY